MKARVFRHRSTLMGPTIVLLGAAAIAAASFSAGQARARAESRIAVTEVSTTAPSPAFTTEAGGAVLADVAEKVISSVVNISSEKIVQETGGSPEFGPLFNDPFFRYFFDGPLGHGRRPQQWREHSLGSGVIVSSDGTVLTNNHVIENADKIRVALADGREFDAEIIGRDPDSDLGVLKLKGDLGDLKPITIGDSNALRLGDIVLAIGDPFGVGQTVTMGIVSAKGRANVGIVEYEDFIQTDAAINPGNSGGALVNMRGELVGINTAIISRSGGYQGIGFAIPSKMALPIMESLLDDGKVERGWLGVVIQDINPELKEALGLDDVKGVLLSDVNAGSPAEKGGLKRGDVILKLDGEPMDSSARLRNAVAIAGPKTEVSIEVLRDGQHIVRRVKLGQRKSGGGVAKLDASDGALGGLTLAEPNPELRRRYDIPKGVNGAVVIEVERGSAAARAGLRPGDVIVEFNRGPVSTVRDFSEAYRKARGVIAVLVNRQGNALYLAIRK